MEPEKLLLRRKRWDKFPKFPKDAWSIPLIWLFDKSRTTRDARSPICWGIEPDSWFSKRLSDNCVKFQWQREFG